MKIVKPAKATCHTDDSWWHILKDEDRWMTIYGTLLAQGAQEIRRHTHDAGWSSDWLEKIAVRMEGASALATEVAQEREIATISRTLIDSGPLDKSASPSFWAAVDAMQRAAKRR
ncbi:hypothetical protein [Cupriavidus pauculus]|uniref:Uncharacterized protein n=1 Tax=Cupriavidus pauculus TaxID=82633 RepID=A0A2N5C5H9_9BURK|nr:hypothetical protein [Cupriavidus pauculus]PLP97468.1 hypothetical protein CYJ10_26910 [Cupriavidus pauculus]